MLYRFNLDLAIPQVVFDAIPAAKKQAAMDAIRGLKALAVRINAGKPNEEITVLATWHRCYHDEKSPKACEPGQEI